MIKKRLLTPGPVDIPPAVLAAASQPAPHHRTPEYRKILQETGAALQEVLYTKNRVLMMAASGTGAMEAAVTNLTAPGDPVVVVVGGVFGERWAELATAYGAQVFTMPVEWGEGASPDRLDAMLKDHPQVKVVFATLSETSTGVDHPVEEFGKVCRARNVLLVVDAISGAGAVPLKVDEWDIDVAVVGSQKALMVPPGLAFAAVSARAWEVVMRNPRPRFYFDFQKLRQAWEKDTLPDTPFTSATSLVLQLHAALKILLAEGMEHIWSRHARYAELVRVGVTAMGLHLFAKTHWSRVLTAIRVPESVDGKKLVKMIRDEFGLSLAGGQKRLEGRIFRIGHVGYVDEFDLMTGLSAVERALHRLGHPVEFGRAQAAAQSLLISTTPTHPSPMQGGG